jgi:hypothetical protein
VVRICEEVLLYKAYAKSSESACSNGVLGSQEEEGRGVKQPIIIICNKEGEESDRFKSNQNPQHSDFT